MTWLAETLMLAHGWRRYAIMLVAGALAGLSAPPFFVLPLLVLGLTLWVWALDGAEPRSGWRLLLSPSFFIGFFFGIGYFCVALHWIALAGLADGGSYSVALLGLGVVVLAAAISFFWGLASVVAHLVWSHGPWRIVGLASALTGAEYIRGHLFTGFPFDLVGYSLTATPELMQAASLVGAYGLTFIALLVGMTPALAWPGDGRTWSRRLLPLCLGLGVMALQLGYGYQRLAGTVLTARTDVRMRLIQPMVTEHVNWRLAEPSAILDRLIGLSTTKLTPTDRGIEGVTHVVWPEASLPFFLNDYPDAYARIARMLPDGVTLLTGAPRHAPRDEESDERPPDFNALLAFDTNGEVVATYDKAHLVPFGEYLPFADLLESFGLRQFVPGANGWTHGDGRRLVSAPGTPPFIALICYEAVFSADLGADPDKAAFLLNITNDGWFDGSVGLAQHANHARLRAVETGLPLIRVANTGLTFVTDPLGRITAELAPGEAALLDVVPDMPIGGTLFNRLGDMTVFAAMLLGGILAAWSSRRTRRPGALGGA